MKGEGRREEKRDRVEEMVHDQMETATVEQRQGSHHRFNLQTRKSLGKVSYGVN